tara:strand:+ start:12 stop:266 length:255 start_codon:yes stop_codon:yes gene_type:complete
MTKEILDTLTDALMGSGSHRGQEVKQKWFMVVSDGKGGTQSYEAGSLYQAQTMAEEWLATGWPAWVEDDKGQALVTAKMPREKN